MSIVSSRVSFRRSPSFNQTKLWKSQRKVIIINRRFDPLIFAGHYITLTVFTLDSIKRADSNYCISLLIFFFFSQHFITIWYIGSAVNVMVHRKKLVFYVSCFLNLPFWETVAEQVGGQNTWNKNNIQNSFTKFFTDAWKSSKGNPLTRVKGDIKGYTLWKPRGRDQNIVCIMHVQANSVPRQDRLARDLKTGFSKINATIPALQGAAAIV
jgi:hypothetical protein